VPIREHEQAAVEALAQLDAATDVGAVSRELYPAGPEADGIVVGDDARVAAAEAAREVAGGGAPGGLGVGGGAGEASGEIGEKGGEEGVGARDGGDAVQAQLGDEAILQGLPEAFDAPLGLGGPRGDKADAEVAQDAPEVGRVLCAAELFVERPVGVVTNEDVEAIAVESQRQPVARAELLEQGDISVQILGGAQDEGQARSRGIVDGTVQGVATTTARTPVKNAPTVPPRPARPCPMPEKRLLISNTPERLRPITKNR